MFWRDDQIAQKYIVKIVLMESVTIYTQFICIIAACLEKLLGNRKNSRKFQLYIIVPDLNHA